MKFFYIALGGAIGSVARYAASLSITRIFSQSIFPWGTFSVNATGALLIGFLWAYSESGLISSQLGFFLFTGILGGFTTFSSFSLETMNLFRTGHSWEAIGYVLMSNVLCIILAFAGFNGGRMLTLK